VDACGAAVAVGPVGGIAAVGCASAVGTDVLSAAGGGVAVAAGVPQADNSIVNNIKIEINFFISFSFSVVWIDSFLPHDLLSKSCGRNRLLDPQIIYSG
jgi:hypothetical protein